MTTIDLLLLLAMLFAKHTVADFMIQTSYQYDNKHIYGHPGGVIHAGLHGIGTYLCIVWFVPSMALMLAVADAVIHYHVDWVRKNITDHYNWRFDNNKYWWRLLGIDEYLHALTYIGLVAVLVL